MKSLRRTAHILFFGILGAISQSKSYYSCGLKKTKKTVHVYLMLMILLIISFNISAHGMVWWRLVIMNKITWNLDEKGYYLSSPIVSCKKCLNSLFQIGFGYVWRIKRIFASVKSRSYALLRISLWRAAQHSGDIHRTFFKGMLYCTVG